MIRVLRSSFSLRCVVFHHISDADTPFTKGLHVSITRRKFEDALAFFARYYTPVSLQQVVAAGTRALPDRALLVTFDDAYASVAEIGVPLCRKYDIPAVFFVNAAFLDNRRVALPNLLAYIANLFGMHLIHAAIRAVKNNIGFTIETLKDVSRHFLAAASLEQRQAFVDALLGLAGIDELSLAQKADLYITSQQLREISSAGVDIGNHTYTHVHCRTLSNGDFAREIDANQEHLEALSNRKLRSFSIPYGSSTDLTDALLLHLRQSGYAAIFLSQNVGNRRAGDPLHLDRVTTSGRSASGLLCDLELFPRLRTMRNRLREQRKVAE
jgi:peptidoglycan/xylan/chitin deacetylase (PgdA/CDA1 family)